MQYKTVIEKINQEIHEMIDEVRTFWDFDTKIVLCLHRHTGYDEFIIKYGELTEYNELSKDQEWYITEYHGPGYVWTVYPFEG
jgi:hypothetical protein